MIKRKNFSTSFCSFRQLFRGSTATKKKEKRLLNVKNLIEIHVFIGLTILRLEKRHIMLRNIEFKTVNLKFIR